MTSRRSFGSWGISSSETSFTASSRAGIQFLSASFGSCMCEFIIHDLSATGRVRNLVSSFMTAICSSRVIVCISRESLSIHILKWQLFINCSIQLLLVQFRIHSCARDSVFRTVFMAIDAWILFSGWLFDEVFIIEIWYHSFLSKTRTEVKFWVTELFFLLYSPCF